jgi:hypothetical protein
MKYVILLALSLLSVGSALEACPRCCYHRQPRTVYVLPAQPAQQIVVLPAPPVRRVVFVPAPRPRPVFNFGLNLGFLFR